MPLALIVEDDEIIRELLSEFLNEIGIKTKLASSVKEGTAIVRNQEIDFVLSDVQLELESGVDLLKDLKNQHSTLPVFMMTGLTGKILSELKDLGADYIFQKPLCLNEIQNYLTHRNFASSQN